MLERPSGPFITGMIAAMRLCAGHSSLSSFRAERGTSPLVMSTRTIGRSPVVCATRDVVRSVGAD
jgi:hypothetical protein